ncbi:uncharacterized protein [Ptychodera flava]|uniref:uncharacterized protein n=1 Tax=Ptychodera flava TaxID=63121 RepID=UPI00396A60B2
MGKSKKAKKDADSSKSTKTETVTSSLGSTSSTVVEVSENELEDGEIIDKSDDVLSHDTEKTLLEDSAQARKERRQRRKLKKQKHRMKKKQMLKRELREAATEKEKQEQKKRKLTNETNHESDPNAVIHIKKSRLETEMERQTCQEKNTTTTLTREEIEKLKAERKIRVKKIMQLPKLFLKLKEVFGRKVEKEGAVIPPLSVKDVQRLVLFALMGSEASVVPRWCQLLRWTKVSSVAVVVLNRITQQHVDEYADCFSNIRELFEMSVPIRQSNYSIEEDFLYHSLTNSKLKKFQRLDATEREKAMQFVREDPQDDSMRDAESNDDDNERNGEGEDFTDFKPDRRAYLLTAEEMQVHGYSAEKTDNMISLKASVTLEKDSPMFSLDCEMCVTKQGHELTRVSIVDENHVVLYDTYVKPFDPIIDYLTQYSGVTKEILDPVSTRLSDVQKKLLELLPSDAILIGQSLENDLKALKLYHPHVIDTSVLFMGHNQHKIGLRNLASSYLRESIQCGAKGHDSVEDAITAMKLVQLKIKKGPSLGSFHDRHGKHIESIFSTLYRENVDSTMVDSLNVVKQFKADPVNSIPCLNDQEALRKIPGALQLGRFVWVQLHSMNTILDGITQDSATISDTLRRLDERVKHIYDALPMKSLYIVLLSGENEQSKPPTSSEMDRANLGRCYMMLKLPPLD